MIITFYRKNVYGNTLFYVADKQIAAALLKLTGSKTIRPQDFAALKDLGFIFEEIAEFELTMAR